ncbi:SpoIIE family protein phosphatase [Acidothermaceae bacterium B102]|nr:SpoIIE family protein phosphatase [Acidothermaceae bacterium B102]
MTSEEVPVGEQTSTEELTSALAESRATAERVASRLRLLGDVSELLSSTLEQRVAVAALAGLVVPQLADWCIVTVAATDGLERDLGWAHRDPASNGALGTYARQQYENMSEQAAVSIALRTGQTVIVREMPPALLDTWVPEAGARADLGVLAPGSVAVLPLNAGGRTLGAMALVTLKDRGPQTAGELETAHDVARRAGIALDNARLYGQQRQLSETLQRSLLTEPPASDRLEIAVRYVPAAAEAQVGGDWYDAFPQPDGELMVVIGDVVGHDSRAAAAMGELRGLLRGIAYTTGAGPGTVLTRLDETIDGLGIGITATSLVAQVDDNPDGARVHWSNAGHPPGIIVDGPSVVVLTQAEPDLMLGIDPRTPRGETTASLPPGATLLLYTDGLIERRGLSIDDGIAELTAALVDLADQPLEQLCDLLLERMLPPAAADDVALIAVRTRTC